MKLSYFTLPIFTLAEITPSDSNFPQTFTNFLNDVRTKLRNQSDSEPADQQIARFDENMGNMIINKMIRLNSVGELFPVIHEVANGAFLDLAVKHNLVNSEVSGFRSTNLDYNCDDNECDVPLNLRGIWGYGCYCNFGNKLTQGKGAPVNNEDSICKRMQLCLRCAEMDGREGGYYCNARTTTYNQL